MAKVVKANLKMKIKGGQASAAPPVGSTLGQYGVNMMDFIQPFNDRTKDMQGKVVTAHITIYDDRTMDFRVVGEPTDDRIRAALGIQKGSGRPNSEKVSKKLSQAQLRQIAEEKAADMNADDVDAIMKMVAGTARSMGVEVEA
ncbi:50S ribosomal protein L11 [Candidatus Saccharibacteria bacterium]|jgi:large subunit ribosomal protein L11|nr:50S ribosomal protein L11 [Candidatus Saccharibacteria bacterium]HPR09249.1 50S ribosomal protein L11 [Candidatus Saccharibacteria bacterium]